MEAASPETTTKPRLRGVTHQVAFFVAALASEPLLLIMGFGMPGDAWLGSLPFLQGFHAIYFDNRGTGQSDKPEGPYTLPQMADDAAGLLDHLKIERAHVYGVSMGGMIAEELVLRHPSRVRSLVLGCTMCGGAHAKLGAQEVIDTLIEVVEGMGCINWWQTSSGRIEPDDGRAVSGAAARYLTNGLAALATALRG